MSKSALEQIAAALVDKPDEDEVVITQSETKKIPDRVRKSNKLKRKLYKISRRRNR